MFITVRRSLWPKQTSLILDRWALKSQEDSETEAEKHSGRARKWGGSIGGGGDEQFKNMMWSFGASPRGNKRFKLGQRRTTHTHTYMHAPHRHMRTYTHTHQTVEFSQTRKQSRLDRQEEDSRSFCRQFSHRQRQRGSSETARGTAH